MKKEDESPLDQLSRVAGGVGRVVILIPTACCGIVWTSGETTGPVMGWTRSGKCGKCDRYLVVGEETLASTTCGRAMNLRPDGSTDEHMKCCDLAFGHEGPHSRQGKEWPYLRESDGDEDGQPAQFRYFPSKS
jgi:hypothetical protein